MLFNYKEWSIIMLGDVSEFAIELLVHPGETVKDVLEEKNISQAELAVRTGCSFKHISEVVRGKKDISFEFASRLEYTLGIPAHFWINLQANYDKEIQKYNKLALVVDKC